MGMEFNRKRQCGALVLVLFFSVAAAFVEPGSCPSFNPNWFLYTQIYCEGSISAILSTHYHSDLPTQVRKCGICTELFTGLFIKNVLSF